MSEMPSKNRLVVGGVLVALVVAVLVAFLLTRGDGDEGGSPDRAATRTATAGASSASSGTTGTVGTTATATTRAAATATPSVPPGMSVVRVGQLPAEARETLRLIDAGGPFPYGKDGTVFGNREGRLPKQKNGYYREYTVDTPGSDDRGARRIIAGASGERYYTSDHYATFRVIVP
ncbi:ribonuclease domain-containing protein [Streptodolium elevatio]